jgi:hypothetical protein
MIGEDNDLPVGGPGANIPAGGAGDNRLIDWGLKPEGYHHSQIPSGSTWIKPFVFDFKPDDPNKDIKIVLSDLVE